LLQAHRYTLIKTHYPRSAARRMEQAGENQTEGCNAIFRRLASILPPSLIVPK
jgi:hypothetical protein